MWAPRTHLGTLRIGRLSLSLWHKDPCTDGSDDSCKHRVLNPPYECTDECDTPPVPMPEDHEYCDEQKRFLRDLKRARRARWLHVHHWRLRVHWRTA